MSTTASAPVLGPVTALDGPAREVVLRPLEHGDSAPVLSVFAGMGPRSRQLRFLVPKPQLSGEDLRRLTHLDGTRHVALVASTATERRPIGIGRFIRDEKDPEAAEVAMAVVDSWQGKGVGTLLLEALVARAGAAGVRRLTGIVSSENAAVLRLLRRSRMEFSCNVVDRWTTEFVASLEGEPT